MAEPKDTVAAKIAKARANLQSACDRWPAMLCNTVPDHETAFVTAHRETLDAVEALNTVVRTLESAVAGLKVEAQDAEQNDVAAAIAKARARHNDAPGLVTALGATIDAIEALARRVTLLAERDALRAHVTELSQALEQEREKWSKLQTDALTLEVMHRLPNVRFRADSFYVIIDTARRVAQGLV